MYALLDPRDGRVRYVGLSSSGLTRPRQHATSRAHARKYPVSLWAKKLRRAGVDYSVVVLERAEEYGQLQEQERFWIRVLRDAGCRLLNLTDGGEGTLGRRRSPEQRERHSRFMIARFQDPLALEAHCAAQKRRWEDPAEHANHSAAMTEYFKDPLVRETRSIQAKRRFEDPETIAKHSAGQKKRFMKPAEIAKHSEARGGRPFYDQFGNRYVTQTEAAKALGLSRSNISLVLGGKRAQTGGFVFTFYPPLVGAPEAV